MSKRAVINKKKKILLYNGYYNRGGRVLQLFKFTGRSFVRIYSQDSRIRTITFKPHLFFFFFSFFFYKSINVI